MPARDTYDKLAPLKKELLDLLTNPHCYEALVDALPSCPIKAVLQLWGYGHKLYPTPPPPRLPSGHTITVTLDVEGAPFIRLTFDATEPFDVDKVLHLTIDDEAPGAPPISFAAAVELAAGALLTYWMTRSVWPPDVRPTEEGSGSA
jgi:hypothetical protein